MSLTVSSNPGEGSCCPDAVETISRVGTPALRASSVEAADVEVYTPAWPRGEEVLFEQTKISPAALDEVIQPVCVEARTRTSILFAACGRLPGGHGGSSPTPASGLSPRCVK